MYSSDLVVIVFCVFWESKYRDDDDDDEHLSDNRCSLVLDVLMAMQS